MGSMTPEERDAARRALAEISRKRRERRKGDALDLAASKERNEEARNDSSFELGLTELIEKVQSLDNATFDKKLDAIQKKHGKGGFFFSSKRKLSSKQQRQVNKAKKLKKKRKGWFS